MNCKIANLELALKNTSVYLNGKKKTFEKLDGKGDEAYHTFIKIEFILGKDLKRVKELCQKFWLTCYKTWDT